MNTHTMRWPVVRSHGVQIVVLDVPVRRLRSNASRLDKNLWRAMRSDKYPNLRFDLSSYTLRPARPGSDTLAVHAHGLLAICSRERPVEIESLMHAGEGGLWWVRRAWEVASR